MAKSSRKRRSTQQLIGKQLEYTGKRTGLNELQLIQYNLDGSTIRSFDSPQELISACDPTQMSWVRVRGLSDVDDVEVIGKAFGLHYVEMQDILMPHHRVKISERDQLILAIVNQLGVDNQGELNQERMAIGFGTNFILTFQEGESRYFEEVTTALTTNEGNIRGRGGDYLFCLFLNVLLDRMGDSLNAMEEGLGELELTLLDSLDPDGVKRDIQSYRRRFQLFKKSVLPLKDSLYRLAKTENSLIHPNVRIYFVDLSDRISALSEALDYVREMIGGLLDLYVSNNDLRMNEIMKRLTVVSTIFIPLTFLAGVWGMNFEWMPELSWRYGYYGAWSVMVLTALFVWWYLKLRKWY